MPTKYWRGGTASWTPTNNASWSLSSGGPANTTAPTSDDDVVFDSLSAAGAYTVTISGGTCKSITFVTNATVIPTFTGSTQFTVNDGDFVLPATGVNWNYTGPLTLVASTASRTVNLNGISVSCSFVFRGTGSFSYGLASAITTTSSISHSQGIFNTNGYSVTATTFNANATSGTVNLGASTLTFSQGFNWAQAATVLNAGTSSIRVSTTFGTFAGGGKTYNDVQFTYTNASFGITRITISGANTFASLTLGGFRNAAALNGFMLSANQIVTGTLTIPGGTRRACRTQIFSDVAGTRRTITAAAISGMQNVDFVDVAAAGASAPWTGASLGDCGNNTGITFPAAKTVYYVGATNNLLFSSPNVWATTPTGVANDDNFPLAQDTAVITNNFPGSSLGVQTGVYNHGTIDMSQRTNALTITPQGNYYGNWITGSGVGISGAGQTLRFSKRGGTQSITSAGKAFAPFISLANLNGTVVLQDALTTAGLLSGDSGTPVTGAGSINDNGYSITFTGTTAFTASTTYAHTLTINGTWTLPVNFTASTLTTPAGSGVLSFTGSGAKTFAGAGKLTWPTLQQGGTGTLTITGSNKFANANNTANGTITFTAGTTNEFSAFGVAGVGGSRITINSTTTAAASLKKPLPWNVGTNSLVANSTNVTAASNTEGVDWLNVSYITGISTVQLLTPSLLTNTQAFYSPTVASASQELVANLFTNTQTFYSAVAAASYTLAPARFDDTEAFYGATVGRGPVTLSASLLANTQTFYAPSVGRGAVTLAPAQVTNSQAFYAPTVTRGAVTLSPARFDNTQTFYAATVLRGAVSLSPSLVGNSQQFYAPAVGRGAVALSPARLDNAQDFHGPTVTATASVLPDLVANTQSFYAATVTPGAINLAAPLVANTQSFYAPSVQPGAVTLAPNLLPSQSAIYAPEVLLAGVNLLPPRVDNQSAFYAATITVGAVVIEPGLLVNAQSFLPASVEPGAVAVSVPLVANAQAFYAPVVQPAAVELAVERVDNAQVFYEAEVIEGAVNLQPERLDNAQAFFGAGVQPGAVTLTASLAINAQVFYPAIVVPGAIDLAAPLVVNASELFEPEVTPGSADVLPQLLVNSQLFYPGSIETIYVLRPPFLASESELYAPELLAFLPNDGSSARGTVRRDDDGRPDAVRRADSMVAADARRFIADNARVLTATRGPIQ